MKVFANVLLQSIKDQKILMEILSFFSSIFIACTLISMTFYSIYTGFGPSSKSLRDPFEEHED